MLIGIENCIARLLLFPLYPFFDIKLFLSLKELADFSVGCCFFVFFFFKYLSFYLIALLVTYGHYNTFITHFNFILLNISMR